MEGHRLAASPAGALGTTRGFASDGMLIFIRYFLESEHHRVRLVCAVPPAPCSIVMSERTPWIAARPPGRTSGARMLTGTEIGLLLFEAACATCDTRHLGSTFSPTASAFETAQKPKPSRTRRSSGLFGEDWVRIEVSCFRISFQPILLCQLVKLSVLFLLSQACQCTQSFPCQPCRRPW